jgi:GNAT superfamily N-acetyltransferase
MTFTLASSSVHEISTYLKIKQDRTRWLHAVCRQPKAQYFYINTVIDGRFQIVGFSYIILIDNMLDCSFYFAPEFRRMGIARAFLAYAIGHFSNIQFTVSERNAPSLHLFDSTGYLKIIKTDPRRKDKIYGPT